MWECKCVCGEREREKRREREIVSRIFTYNNKLFIVGEAYYCVAIALDSLIIYAL